MKKKEPFIFVSYSHKDTQLVLPLINGLQERGFRVWYDAGIQAGTEWPEYIARKVYDCGCLLAIVTQNSAESPNCRREINFALELKKDLLSVYMIEPDELSLGLRMQLNTLQAIFMKNSPDRETFLDTLAIAEILKPCKGEWSEETEEESEAIRAALQLQAESANEESQPEQVKAVLWEDGAYLYKQGLKCEETGEAEEAFRWFTSAAGKGHGEAMYRLAQCFREGYGTEADSEQAYHYYKLAAKQGVTAAMLQQGKLYELTNGTMKGREEAFLQFSIAAKLGNVEAMYELGVCYLEGIGTAADENAAVMWLENAAEQEWAAAMYRLGMYYRYGNNAEPVDREKAHKWFDSAAYWRHPQAMYQLGELLREDGKKEEAQIWFERAAERHVKEAFDVLWKSVWNEAACWLDLDSYEVAPGFLNLCRIGAEMGHWEAMTCYAKSFEKSGAYEEAVKWYQKAANKDSVRAMISLGILCQKGLGIERDDRAAVAWYRKAKDRGYFSAVKAMLYLGRCYRDGRGVEQDAKAAFEMFSYGAQHGNAEAMWELVDCCSRGIGTEKDLVKAFDWCKEAAEYGHTEAMYTLRKLYAEGIGTEKNPEAAFQWCKKAAGKEHTEAMYLLGCYYAEGFGTAQSPTDSFAWFQRAGGKEHDLARVAEGMCYCYGFGTPENINKGMAILSSCRHPDAQYACALICRENDNLLGTDHFYRSAAAAGHEAAYEYITTDPQYRRRMRRYFRLRFEHDNAVRDFVIARGLYRPVFQIPKDVQS